MSAKFWQLGSDFYHRIQIQTLDNSFLIHKNCDLLSQLDLNLSSKDFLSVFSGQSAFNATTPIASIYAGYQFGYFNPQLGDGRSCLIGKHNGYELSLKGAGMTPFSRDGDGRAVLRSSIREYLCSHAMDKLNIPTTQSLSLVGSTTEVYREKIETGAMISRVAKSHIRFGHFELFASREQFAQVKKLADFVIENYFIEIKNDQQKYHIFFDQVIKKTAVMIAKWQAIGFTHGVMNTDNMSILGLTLDYGPFGFLEQYDPDYICNHSDHQGRYAFGAQPQIALWNLTKLAQALVSLIKPIEAAQLLEKYQPYLVVQYSDLMRAKLGLVVKDAKDNLLLNDFLSLLQQHQKDYTNSFRALSLIGKEINSNPLGKEFAQWVHRYQTRLLSETQSHQSRIIAMNKVNPAYILRNHLVEVAIGKAQKGNYTEVQTLFTLLSNPFELKEGFEQYQRLSPDWAKNLQISCSS